MSSIQPEKGPLILNPDQLADLWMFDPATDDSPRRRIGRLATTRGSNLYDLIPFMNMMLEDPKRNYAREGGGVIVKSILPSGLSSTIGLVFSSDMRESVLPTTAKLGREIAESGLSEEEKLHRLANMTGTMIVEAQSFNFGNKRTARAMYGRILYGRDGIARGHDEDIDFEPPEELDRLVMLQNVTRLRAERDGIITPRAFGGVYVDASVQQQIANMVESVEAFRFRHGKTDDKPKDNVERNIYQLRVDLESTIPDVRKCNRLINILFQEDYGPAVCSLVFNEPCDIFESLNAETIIEIINTNTRLLSMRLKSFMAAAACGGYFVSIEDSAEEDRARQIVKTKWEPVVLPYVPKHRKPSEEASTVSI